jgi:hypothetical protein
VGCKGEHEMSSREYFVCVCVCVCVRARACVCVEGGGRDVRRILVYQYNSIGKISVCYCP